MRRSRKTLFSAFLLFLVITFAFIALKPKKKPSNHTLPIVLSWSRFFDRDFSDVLLEQETPECERKCIFSSDKRLLTDSSLILFHPWNFFEDSFPTTAPHQTKVFFSHESPSAIPKSYFKKVPRDYFNLTGSYRLDSNIVVPYARFRKLKQPKDRIPMEIENVIKKKTDLAFQLISNCWTYSKREFYLRELARHANITGYGRCSDRRCDKECEEKAIESHFFFFAFENSVCQDYLTEKFFRLRHGIVPVVLSRKHAAKSAPDGSFIAADDFASPKELASFLTHLMRTPREYERYFDWMKHYELADDDATLRCQLCKAAHEKRRHTVDDIKKWWYGGQCEFGFAARNLTLSFYDNAMTWLFVKNLGDS